MLKNRISGPKIKNSRVIRDLARKTIIANKWKSAVVIISIALCTFMFTTLFTISGSIAEKLQETTQRQTGSSSDASLKYLNEEEYNRLKNDEKLKEVSARIYVGEAVNPELFKLRTEVHWSDEVSAEKMFCSPEVGSLPAHENEIAVSSLVLKAFGLDAESDSDYEELIDSTLPLKMECKNGTIEKEFEISGIFTGDRVAMSQMVFVSREFQERYAPTPQTSYYGDGNESTVSDTYGRIDADIDFYIPIGVKGQLYNAIIRDGMPQNVETGVNWGSFGSADYTTVLLVIALLFTIFMSGYLIINNVYRINVYADIRSYGLLKTVGTSGRQLKRIVRWQAVYHSVPGIVLGMLFGVIVGSIILPRVMGVLIFSDSVNTKAVINMWILLFSAAFSYATVLISIRRSMKMASQVSPIEALRITDQFAGRNTVFKKRSRSFSAFDFAIRNALRDKKKVFFVVLSLSLSLVVLNSVYTLVDGFDEDKYVEHFIRTDFSVADANTDNPALTDHNYEGVTKTFLSELEKQDGILSIGNIYYAEEAFWQDLNDRDFERIRERLIDNENVDTWMRSMDDNIYEQGTIAKIYGMDEYAVGNINILSGKYDSEEFATGKYILVNEYSAGDDDHVAYFLPGETVTVKNKEGEERDYTVMATVDIPYALRIQNYMDLDVSYIFPADEFNDFFGSRNPMRCLIDVTDEAEPTIENWIRNFTENQESSLLYTSREVYKKDFSDFTNMLKIVGGMLTIILAMIGILNLINTLITSIISRRLEFAMLEAVGMTKRIQRRSLCFEGVIYGILAALGGLVLSGIFSFFLVRGFGSDMWYFTWRLTLLPVVILIPVMIVIAIILPVVIYKLSMKQSVVERLRMAEA